MRTRIIAAVAILVTIALTLAGVIIYVLESARLRSTAATRADQEIMEFQFLQNSERFTQIDDLLKTFLDRNVPNDNEMLVGWVNNEPRYRSSQQHTALTEDPTFRDELSKIVGSGGSTTTDSPYGELLINVQPVLESAQPDAAKNTGALVVVSFLHDGRSELLSLLRTYAIVGLLSLGAITVLARWQAGRLLAPLRRLNDTARQIGSTDLSSRIPETGNDDITALTRTVNAMLTRLEGSFTSQRQFLDDAGHELRTPLTVLRGHLELLDPNDPADVGATKDLLLDEIDRMSRLVGDLTLLAKSNRNDFLSVKDVDLDRLTRSAHAKALALGQRHWVLDAVGSAALRVDEQRLTQALLQLADNAVKHTDTDAEIGIGSQVTNDHIRLWVRDTGDGVPPADREIIFERFGRGATRPDDEGFGLGLSIVKAIAVAHHGSVSVTSATPRGAEFSITLPLEDSWPAS